MALLLLISVFLRKRVCLGFHAEYQAVAFADFGMVRESFPSKSLELFGIFYAVAENEAGHFATAHFGIYHHGGWLTVFQGVKLGSDDTHGAFHFLPVKQVFHFGTGQYRGTLPLQGPAFCTGTFLYG